MVLKHIYVKESHITFLKSFSETTFSEHARLALDDYVERLQAKKSSASTSKVGEFDE